MQKMKTKSAFPTYIFTIDFIKQIILNLELLDYETLKFVFKLYIIAFIFKFHYAGTHYHCLAMTTNIKVSMSSFVSIKMSHFLCFHRTIIQMLVMTKK